MVSKFKLFAVSAIAAVSLSLSASAQVRPDELLKDSKNYFEAGAKLGADFQQLSAYPFATSYTPGGNGGLYVKKRHNAWGVQLELTASSAKYTTEYPVAHNYTLSRTRYADSTTKGEFSALYLNIPLLIEVRPGNHFAFQFGAQYSYLLSQKDDNGVFTKRYGSDEILKKSNVSIVTGFELDIYKDLKMGARYAVGFSDMNNGKFAPLTDKWQINSAQVFFIYRFEKFRVR